MVNLFIDILEITLPISAWIAVLLLFSPLLKKSYVAKWRYFMWLFVAIRLVLPFRFHSPITLNMPTEITAVTETVNTSGFIFSVPELLTCIWLLGIAVLSVYQIVSYLSFGKTVRAWGRKIEDAEINRAFETAKRSAGVKRDIKIMSCKLIKTPMIFGILRPVLLLPEIEFSKGELPIILRHELVHLRRQDIWYKLLLIAARTVHWFNPFAYLMVKAANRDMELACDAEVVKNEDAAFRTRYCEAIMRLVHNGRGKQTALSTCFIFSKKTILERFKNIVDEKIKRNGVVMFCVVAVSVAVSCGAVTFATEQVAEVAEEDLQIVERPIEAPKSTEQPVVADAAEENTVTDNAAEENAPENNAQNSASDSWTARDNSGDTGNSPSNSSNNSSGNSTNYAPYYDAAADTARDTGVTASDTADSGETSDAGGDGDIYGSLGSPDSVSGDGSRETYTLSDGSTAVVQYDGDVMEAGYILVE